MSIILNQAVSLRHHYIVFQTNVILKAAQRGYIIGYTNQICMIDIGQRMCFAESECLKKDSTTNTDRRRKGLHEGVVNAAVYD